MSACLRVCRFGLWTGLVLLTLCGVQGCGSATGDRPPLGKVTGHVLLDGEPLTGVIVLFSPETGRPAAGLTDEEGRYELEYTHRVPGAKVGPNMVSLQYPTGAGGRPIPARYTGESELQVEVKPSSQVLDFTLLSK